MSSELDPELRQLMADALRDLKGEGKMDANLADRMLKDVVQDPQHSQLPRGKDKQTARWWQFWK